MVILKFGGFEGQKSRGSHDRKKLKFFVRKIELEMSKKMAKKVGGHLAQHGENRGSKSRNFKITIFGTKILEKFFLKISNY